MKKEYPNISALVREKVDSSKISYTELAKKLNLTKNGLNHRLKNPFYGNVHDLIQTSIILKADFVTPIMDYLLSKNVPIHNKYNCDEILKENLDLKKDLELSKKMVENLLTKDRSS